MKYLRDLYLDKESKKTYRFLLRNIANKRAGFGQYLLVLREDRLEIYTALSFVRNADYLSEVKVIGMAKGKSNAISLVRDIVEKFGLDYIAKLNSLETME